MMFVFKAAKAEAILARVDPEMRHDCANSVSRFECGEDFNGLGVSE